MSGRDWHSALQLHNTESNYHMKETSRHSIQKSGHVIAWDSECMYKRVVCRYNEEKRKCSRKHGLLNWTCLAITRCQDIRTYTCLSEWLFLPLLLCLPIRLEHTTYNSKHNMNNTITITMTTKDNTVKNRNNSLRPLTMLLNISTIIEWTVRPSFLSSSLLVL
jgi:hypothetical protein